MKCCTVVQYVLNNFVHWTKLEFINPLIFLNKKQKLSIKLSKKTTGKKVLIFLLGWQFTVHYFSCRSFCCFVCGAVFKTLKNFERHQSSSSHNYSCRRCPRVYSSDRQLRRHMKVSHSNRDKIQCNICRKQFSHSYTYQVKKQKVILICKLIQ